MLRSGLNLSETLTRSLENAGERQLKNMVMAWVEIMLGFGGFVYYVVNMLWLRFIELELSLFSLIRASCYSLFLVIFGILIS